MLCDLCKCVFSGSSEPSPEGHDEYLHHRSSHSLATALAEGCQLCLILQDLLPEHVFTSDWEYRPSDQDHQSSSTTGEASPLPDDADLATAHREHAARLFPFRSNTSSYRRYYMGQREGNRSLDTHDPTERRFALIYFRSATVDNLPTIEFLALGPTGRAAINGIFPLKILLFNQGQPAPGEKDIPFYNALSNWSLSSSTQVAGVEADEDYRFNSSSTSETSVWDVARSWLADCPRNHPACALRSKSFYPSRLVYLEDAIAGQDVQNVKLYHTAELIRANALPPAYMTLSHRWSAASDQFTLMSDNIDLLSEGVPVYILPQTFRDALQFASYCKVKFVWIDALCIVQDDVEDWAREAPLMGSIYYNAVCNLNATASKDSMDGLFTSRNSCHGAPLVVSPDPCLWDKVGGITINPLDQYACVAQDFWERSINQAVVNKRAWVMQERLLSARKMFFSEHQLFWECRQKRACEAFPRGNPEDPLDIFPRTFGRQVHKSDEYVIRTIDALIHQQRHGEMRGAAVPEDRKTLLVAWSELLQRYSTYGLSYTKDRLMAIKGITTYLEEAMNDECIYGLWRKELPYQLFFMYGGESVTDGRRTQPEGNPNVPTWSWAHLDKGLQSTPDIDDPEDDIRTQGGPRTPLISVLEILEKLPPDLEADIASGKNLQSSSSGCLHLKCHLFACTVDQDKWGENTDTNLHVLMHLGYQTYQAHVVFDGEWPNNACIMPVFWHNEKYGKAIVVSRVGGEDSPMTFTRTGFLGATAVFWNWFQMYWKLAAAGEEQEIWLL